MPSRTIFLSVPLSFCLSVSLSRTHQYAPPQPTSTNPARNEYTEKICATKRPTLKVHFYFFGIFYSCLISYFLFLFDGHHVYIYQMIKNETYSANTATHCNTLQHTALFLTHAATYCNFSFLFDRLYSQWQLKRATQQKMCQVCISLCNKLQHTAAHCSTLQCTQCVPVCCCVMSVKNKSRFEGTICTGIYIYTYIHVYMYM